MQTYFELEDDLDVKGRWYLNGLRDSAGIALNEREFGYGKPVNLGPPISATSWKDGLPVAAQPPLQVLLDPKRKGVPLDFTFTSSDMPVVTSKVAHMLASLAGDDIQRIPVRVQAQDGWYEIINVIALVDCIDTERSEIQWFEEGNDIRPDLAGKPEMVTQLVVNADRAGKHQIFRVEDWPIALIVSAAVKKALEEANVSGVKFHQVTL